MDVISKRKPASTPGQSLERGAGTIWPACGFPVPLERTLRQSFVTFVSRVLDLSHIGIIQESTGNYMNAQSKRATDRINVIPPLLPLILPPPLVPEPPPVPTNVELPFSPGEHAPLATSTPASGAISESSNSLILFSGTPVKAALNRASVLFPPETLRIQMQETDEGCLRKLIAPAISNSTTRASKGTLTPQQRSRGPFQSSPRSSTTSCQGSAPELDQSFRAYALPSCRRS